jgi:ubiquinone/menaquinone biosynthesis C-methylase UbiE
MTERKHLGECSDVAAAAALTSVAGLTVVDVGCGAGKTSRELAAIGARVIGVEPDPIQAVKNREAEPTPGVAFVEARAESLPVSSGSADGVFFFRSLHHVPVGAMEAALAEAARALKPETGFLCVVEPGMGGSHFPVMRPFHDETRVRDAAQAALERNAQRLFRQFDLYRYVQYPRYADFEALVTRVMGQTFNDIRRERVETDEVRALFEAGRTDRGDYIFEQPMLLDFYRGPLRSS